jgi:hypothetical protein
VVLGYSQLSRQAVERGILTEDTTTSDLLKRVAVSLDAQLLSLFHPGSEVFVTVW